MPTILLTDPDQRAALAAARALGQRGWLVHTVGPHRGIAGVSRYVRRHHTVTAEQVAGPAAFVKVVTGIVAAERIDVVIPVSDRASRALLGRHQEIRARIAGPSREAYESASDKQNLLDAAHVCGLRTPRQQVLNSERDVAARVGFVNEFMGASVVKPARSVVEVNGKSVSVGVSFVAKLDDLAAALASYPPEAYPLLIQERTFGDGIGVFLLRTAGETRLSFGHRRIREKPPAGGVSTYREAICPPRSLVERCERLLDSLQYDGAAMIEFKQDNVTGEYVLMEINARLWGSLQLAVDAGVDFPSALVEMALGMPLSASTEPRFGTRTVWELGEVDHALMLLRRSKRVLNLPEEFAVGWRAAARVLLDHRRGDSAEVFRLSDPMPFAAELTRWLLRR